MAEALISVVMRWLHIASVAALIGGALYGCGVAARSLHRLAPDTRESLLDEMAAHFRPLVYLAVGGLVVSGLYNLIAHPGHTALYHALIAIKLLLVLHVFAVMLLSVQPNAKRRVRMMAGAAISGLVIIAISAYLRRIF